jgi:hypothetical protein
MKPRVSLPSSRNSKFFFFWADMDDAASALDGRGMAAKNYSNKTYEIVNSNI